MAADSEDAIVALARREWIIRSGLRLMRMNDPTAAEHDRRQTRELERQRSELIAQGRLAPLGAYNTVRRQIDGTVRYITTFPEQSGGRSWTGAIPDEYRHLETFDYVVVDPNALHEVRDIIINAAAAMPAEVRTPVMNVVAEIDKERKPAAMLVDLGAFTARSSSPAQARLNAWQAGAILDLFDAIAPLNDGNVATRSNAVFDSIVRRYSEYRMSGVHCSLLLLFTEVIRAAHPQSPFGLPLPSFVCGIVPCRHRICAITVRAAQGAAAAVPLPGEPAREAMSYVLRNTVDPLGLLRELAGSPNGAVWLRHACDRLFQEAAQRTAMLPQQRGVIDFYQVHFAALPFFRAAMVGYQSLAHLGAKADRRQFAAAAALAEEGQARAVAALACDFENALDYRCVTDLRRTYEIVSRSSTTAGTLMVQKFIFDERQIPEFWEPYVTGKSDALPLQVPL